MLVTRSAAMLVAAVLLSACQTDGVTGTRPSLTQNEASRISKPFYTPFYDQTAHLRDLVQARNFTDGSVLVAEQWAYFSGAMEQNLPALSEIATYLNDQKTPVLNTALSTLRSIDPTAPAQWPQMRDALGAARRALQGRDDHPLLKADDGRFGSPLYGELDNEIATRYSGFIESAPGAFASFDHFGGRSFFDAYPVDLKRPDFLDAHFARIEPQLAAARADQLERFAAAYPRDAIGAARWAGLGAHLYRAYLAETPTRAPADLQMSANALKRLTAAGFPSDQISQVSIAFVEVTSRTLLKDGQIMFPAQIEADIPVQLSKAELEDAFRASGAAPYTIVFDVALAKASRKVSGVRKTPSQSIVGYVDEPNPNYRMIQEELTNARQQLNSATTDRTISRRTSCLGGIDCIGNVIGSWTSKANEDKAKENVDALMAKLRQTPIAIKKPVYQRYEYDLATVDARKVMTVNYYVVDRKAATYFKSTFDVEERKKFEVAYALKPGDPEKDAHISAANSEKDVVEWEEAPSSVKLSQLIDHYIAHGGAAKPLPAPERLRAEMLQDKNMALAKAKEETFTATPQADPRFESVVVVFNPDRTLGSGFFVASDIVMTNYHVVGERDFLELKMHGGLETFGKVIARDVRLDLALIRVQSRGKPVKFFEANTLDLGSTVEVIGHPRGLEFSITRGIVSAVREAPNANIQDSRKVLFVQIDAATNPGNSGGPVFVKDRVVGVVSYGKSASEGLNFTVHYSEAFRFLKENLNVRS